jgi:hypothetical protein
MLFGDRDRFSVDDVPTFLGGKCRCPATGGCVLGLANEQKESNLEVINNDRGV